jgi:hypothetical protein
MKYLYLGIATLGFLALARPDLLAKVQTWLGATVPGAPTTTGNTGAAAPISNPTAPQTIGTLDITGSKFGTQNVGVQNSVT